MLPALNTVTPLDGCTGMLITTHIQRVSASLLRVEQGTLDIN